METAGNKHVSHESEQSNTNNNTNNNISNERPVQPPNWRALAAASKEIQMLMMSLRGALTAASAKRSIWMRRRRQEWWDVAGYTEQEFFQNFRMSRNTFHHICQRLYPRLLRDTSFRRSISLRKQVGVGLYWVATVAGYRTLANLFGIAKSSVYAIVHDFCKAMHQVLMPDYIKLSQGDDLQEVLRGFRQNQSEQSPPVMEAG